MTVRPHSLFAQRDRDQASRTRPFWLSKQTGVVCARHITHGHSWYHRSSEMSDRSPMAEAEGGKGRHPMMPIGAAMGAPAVGRRGGGGKGGKGVGEGRPWSVEGYQLWESAARTRPVDTSPLGLAPGLLDFDRLSTRDSPQVS